LKTLSSHRTTCAWCIQSDTLYINFVPPFTQSREWREEDIAFGKERLDFFRDRDEDRAQSLKDEGNKNFKLGFFNDAARLYTKALKHVPHSLELSKARNDGSRW